jgi:predicted nucleotidyltransferase
MLTRVQSFTVFDQYSVKVLSPEDIIGLKVQAIANEPSRHAADFQDMRLLLKYKKMNQQNVDWELLKDYFDLFNKQNLLVQLRNEFS